MHLLKRDSKLGNMIFTKSIFLVVLLTFSVDAYKLTPNTVIVDGNIANSFSTDESVPGMFIITHNRTFCL